MDGQRKLFLSFSGLVGMMKNGTLSPGELKDALFYFGCGRDYLDTDAIGNPDIRRAFNLGKAGEDLEGAVSTHDGIRTAVFLAEDERRAFLPDKDQLTFENLNLLLARNGIDPSSVRGLKRPACSIALEPEEKRYTYPAVRKNYGSLVDVMIM